MIRILTVLIVITFFGLPVSPLYAQEVQEETRQSLLPDIDPQDIEIRSQFQARFPGLLRQPILGFNPRPRVYQTDPNRLPFFEDEETVAANLPLGRLDRPDAPVYNPLGYADPKNGFFRAGLGNYVTPEADLYLISGLGNKNWISANINHRSSDGHIDDVTSSYRNLNGSIQTFSSISERTKFRANAGFISNFNHFPGMVGNPDDLSDLNSRIGQTGFHGGLNLDKAQTSLSGFELALGGYVNDFNLQSDLAEIEGKANEWGFRGKAEYSRLGQNIQEVHRLRIKTDLGGIQTIGSARQNWSVTSASAHYERLYNYTTDVKAALGVSGVSDAGHDFRFYLAPSLSLTHTLFNGLNIHGKASGSASHTSYGYNHSINRFLDFSAPLQHQYEWLALAEIEMEPFTGTKLGGGISYQNIKNYLYYRRGVFFESSPDEAPAYYQPAFENASIMKVYGKVSQELRPEVLFFRADGFWQRPRLTGGEKIPFVESFGIKSTISYRISRQALVEGWGELIGNRQSSSAETLSSVVIFGSRFEISLSEHLGVYGKLLNLLNQEYELWPGYPEKTFQGFVGFTYLF